tara:strand:+ start:1217 stop:1669 length:453 start_codon:yes stop_codon:yes gene_type:complete
MIFARENLDDIYDELLPLLESHWKEIALNQDKIKLNPDFNRYRMMQVSGACRIYTARDEGVLVGYFVVLLSASLHYSDHVFANCDIIYIKPNARAGMNGARLIKYVEKDLSDIGVSLLLINTKAHAPFDRLLERLEYNMIERIYSKYIGE